MSDAKSGFGTKLQYATGPVVVGELTNIGGPGMSADTIDVTSHSSADGYREFIQGIKDGGEISMEGNFIKADVGQVALLASFNSGVAAEFNIVFLDSSDWTFTAIVTGVECSAPYDDKIGFSATMKISGKPVFTAGV